jgi:signal transduction histidine kinase
VDSFLGATGPIAREAQRLGIRASIGCPITVDGRLWGVIAASTTRAGAFPADTESRIADFTELVATAISNAEARADLVASRARLLTAADEARRRVVRDLHDGAQQRLVHTVITVGLAERALEHGEAGAPGLVSEALGHARGALEELRDLSHGILPADLTRGGLRAGVDAVAERLALPVEVDVPAQRLPADVEANAYFVVAEALTNVLKHARAECAQVSASIDDGTLRVEVRDDGIGGADPSGHGLVGMSDRVAALGGRLAVDSPAGGGTVVTATLPAFREPLETV